MTITTADGKVAEGLEQAPFEPIAVVGIGAMMPDADAVSYTHLTLPTKA